MCVDEDYKLWLAELKKQEAEKLLSSVGQALERTKSRATNLLGWMITLTVGMGTVSFSKLNPYPYSTIILGSGFFVTACLCVAVLISTKWKYPLLNPNFIDCRAQVKNQQRIKLIEDIAIYITNCTDKNVKTIITLQTLMRSAWIIAVVTPLLALIETLFIVLFIN